MSDSENASRPNPSESLSSNAGDSIEEASENKTADEDNPCADPNDSATWVLPPLRGVWYLTGPTASGKTPAAIELATKLDAEIISLDSMAIYAGMDIGTAKPSREERERIAHHLIDIVSPTEDFSVSSYVMAAHEKAREIRSRNKRVLVSGGTPLYLKSLVRGMFLGPPADWDFRNAVEADLNKFGPDALRERLQQVDPLLTHKLHPNDHRRMIRALEVAKITGRPLSHWQLQFEEPASRDTCAAAVLQLERGWLHERINSRVDAMLSQGLETEVKNLLQQHGSLGRTASQAVGYREMIDCLNGSTTAKETEDAIKAHTRQFARRQEIWFRGLDELQGIKVLPASTLSETVEQLIQVFERVPQQEINSDAE